MIVSLIHCKICLHCLFSCSLLRNRMILSNRCFKHLKRIYQGLDSKLPLSKFFATENDQSSPIVIPSVPSDYVVPDIWQPPSDENMGKFGGMNSHLAGARSEAQLPRGKHDLQLYNG